jgi:AraC-like DNA-binding protein
MMRSAKDEIQRPHRTVAMNMWFCDESQSPLGRLIMSGFVTHRGIPPHAMRLLGSYALIYVLEGSGSYQDANHHLQKVREGDLLLLFPEIAHSYGPPPNGHWHEFFLHFDGPVFDLWRSSGLLNSAHPVHHLEPIPQWREKLHQIARPSPDATLVQSVDKLCRFLSTLTAITGANVVRPEHEQHWLARACKLLEGDLNEEIHLEAVAHMLGFSYGSFRQRFQQEIGVSPARYRAMRRIEAACSMLQRMELTNDFIGHTLGFSDAAHFSKRFKHIMGLTPREYRQRLRKGETIPPPRATMHMAR